VKIIKFKLSENTILELVEIPAGSFLMGSGDLETEKRENETPQHEVNLKSFYLGKFPVTQAQWFAVMNDSPQITEEFRGDDLPVINVWLEKSIEFCAKLSSLTGETFRLPSEAEWEYACRAGTITPFSFGASLTTDLANFNGEQSFKETPKGEFRKSLTPVGSFPPNAFGLYDMHGNVWEWCADIWHENYSGAPTDGSAWLTNGDQSYCVQRGGSWVDRASNCRSAFRVGDIAHNNDHIVGLRVCLSKL
jgi:formylglycine-generating enzyme required for sulfatase activity